MPAVKTTSVRTPQKVLLPVVGVVGVVVVVVGAGSTTVTVLPERRMSQNDLFVADVGLRKLIGCALQRL